MEALVRAFRLEDRDRAAAEAPAAATRQTGSLRQRRAREAYPA